MALKTNFGSIEDILMKFGLIVNLADMAIYISYDSLLSFYVDFHLLHWCKCC